MKPGACATRVLLHFAAWVESDMFGGMKAMRKFLLLVVLMAAACSTVDIGKHNQSLAVHFYEAFNQRDTATLAGLVGAELELVLRGHKTANAKAELLRRLAWHAALSAELRYEDLKVYKNTIVALEVLRSDHTAFFYGRAVYAERILRFDGDTIIGMELNLLDANEQKRRSKRRKLEQWLRQQHPDLAERCFEISREGAEALKQAMALWKAEGTKQLR